MTHVPAVAQAATPSEAATRPAPTHAVMQLRRTHHWTGWAYLAPGILVFGFTVAAPLVYALWVSFYSWDGVTHATWVGLHNYVTVFTDASIGKAAIQTLILFVFYTGLPIVFGTVYAAVIARYRIALGAMWRTILFLPQVLSVVVIGVVWQWLLQMNGPINNVLRSIGLGSLARPWLGDFTLALPAEGIIGTWILTGLCMVLLLAGAQLIDPQLYDAANIDGAGPIKQFLNVTVPGLRNVIIVCVVLTAAMCVNNFAIVWVTTHGGPGTQTEVISTALYRRAFIFSDLGTASALAVVVFAIMAIVAGLTSRRSESEQ